MRTVMTIALREVKAYFSSWMAYATIAGFLLITGFIYFNILVGTAEDVQMKYVFSNMAVTMLFIIPLLTMRLLAEEKGSGTIELLLTSPVTDWQVILGKFLGGLSVLLAILVLTFQYPLILMHYGKPDPGPLFTSYIGLLLVVCSFVAVGIFASSVTDSQVVAGFLAFGILLALWIIAWVSDQTGPFWGEVFKTLSILPHLEDYTEGLIDTKHLVYQISFTFFWLYCSVRVLESRKWR